MELVTSFKNSKELNKIRKCMIEQVLGASVYFSSYTIIGSETQRFYVETDERITEIEKTAILNLMKTIKCDDIFLYCGYDLPIKQLKLMNSHFNRIINYKDLYFVENGTIPEELLSFAHNFLKYFTYNYTKLKVEPDIMRHTLGLNPLGLTYVSLEHNNGRVYLKDDNTEHSMEHEDLSKHIYNKMTESNSEVYCDIENESDKINVERVVSGKSPIMPVEDLGNFQKFKILLSFMKICDEEDHCMLSPITAHQLFNSHYGYNYYSLRFGRKLEEEYEQLDIEYYKEHEYYNLEEALSFAIYLSGLNIKHFLFENKLLKSFTVCYSYVELLEPNPNYEDMKKRVTSLYEQITSSPFDHVYGRRFEEMSLKTLMNCFIIDNTIVFRDYNTQHINPTNNEPLPLHYYECIKYRSDGLYNVYDISKGIFKHYPLYDRSKLEVRNVDIEFEDDNIIVHGVNVGNMIFEDKRRAKEHVMKCWKKGYFLNTFGLNYYIETGEISRYCIKRPIWFSFNNSNETNLFRFLEFNNL